MFAEILSPEILIVAGLVFLLFGGSQLPKLARSLGSARREFLRGQEDTDRGPADGRSPTTKPSA